MWRTQVLRASTEICDITAGTPYVVGSHGYHLGVADAFGCGQSVWLMVGAFSEFSPD
jgi:hypothetical protein